jgi:hypothetical protein
VGILTDALREGPRSWQPPLARPCRIFFCAVKWAGWEGASGRLPPSLDSLKRHGARNYRMAGAFLPSRGRGTAAVGVCFLLHRQSSRINAPHHFHQRELQRRRLGEGWRRTRPLNHRFPSRSMVSAEAGLSRPPPSTRQSSRLNTACGCRYRRPVQDTGRYTRCVGRVDTTPVETIWCLCPRTRRCGLGAPTESAHGGGLHSCRTRRAPAAAPTNQRPASRAW